MKRVLWLIALILVVCMAKAQTKVNLTNQVQGILPAANGGTGTSTALSLSFIQRGLIGLYLFNEGAGSHILVDTSGANHCSNQPCNITLTGAPTDPTLNSLGLNLQRVSAVDGSGQIFISLPAGIASFRSMTIGTYLAAPGNGVFLVPTTWASNQLSSANNYFTLFSTATPCCSGNFQIMAGANVKGFGNNPYIQSTSTPTTQIVDSFVGVGTRTWTLGTGSGDLDHYYINGAEGNYLAQGSSAANAVGTFTLGSIGWLHTAGRQTGFPGTATCLALYSVELTASEALQNNLVCNQLMSNRGLNIVAQPAPNIANEIACTGDSIFSDVGFTTPLCSLLSGLSDAYSTNANGLPSWTCKEIQTLVPFREALLFTGYTPKAVSIVECGNNDAQAGASTIQVVDANIGLANALGQAGAHRIFLTTLMSSVGYGTTDATTKDLINPILREAAQANGWGLIDYASFPNLGADNAASNTTYFLDGIHPTQFSKTSYMALSMDNALNELYGSTQAGGCPTIISSTTYSEAAADGCIRANSTANAVAVTLPLCAGYFRPRAVKNQNGSNAVTVLPASPDLIDGSASAITVATGATLIVYPRVVDATGVCSWQRSQNN